MYRHVHLSVLSLGALMIAGCGSETPPVAGNANCEFRQSADGTLECVPLTQSGGPGSPSAGVGSPGAGVPDLGGGTPAVPDLGGGTPAVPDLGGGPTPAPVPGAATGPVANVPGAGPSDVTGPGPVDAMPGPVPADVAGPAPTDGAGPTPSDVAGPTATEVAGPAPSDVTGPVAAGGGGPVATGGSGPVASGGSVSTPAAASLGSIQVSAGSLARDHTIVTFQFPQGDGKFLALQDSQGNEIPLQMSLLGDGKATFVLESLGAGQDAVYTIVELPQASPAGITAAQEGDHLYVTQGESPVFRWTNVADNFRGAASRDVRAGYIYPVYTPGGLNVADDYAPDHPHMHGIWSAWTNTTFRGHKVDFWNGYADQGRVDLASTDGLWSGPVHAGILASLVHSDITTEPDVAVLTEKWVVTVYKAYEGAPPYYIYEVDSVQEAVTSDPLYLEEYHYGGFGYRGSEQWATTANVNYLTSEGHTRANGDGQNARWCAQYGTVDGQRGGYAAMDHPTNFRHPQGLRIHPSNPYWAFVPVTPLKGGAFTLEPGVPYHSLYRIVAFDGDADAALLNRLWDDFATPPTVQVLP